ncbi:MAG: hypothetical protein BAJALOKI1v1_440024 [Promethearchaeota archaeon]|nr:MAG: hypothetical protein BAJALOKI1v1_440024 [Candidatus Lokiarchaeota archaeon]
MNAITNRVKRREESQRKNHIWKEDDKTNPYLKKRIIRWEQ